MILQAKQSRVWGEGFILCPQLKDLFVFGHMKGPESTSSPSAMLLHECVVEQWSMGWDGIGTKGVNVHVRMEQMSEFPG